MLIILSTFCIAIAFALTLSNPRFYLGFSCLRFCFLQIEETGIGLLKYFSKPHERGILFICIRNTRKVFDIQTNIL